MIYISQACRDSDADKDTKNVRDLAMNRRLCIHLAAIHIVNNMYGICKCKHKNERRRSSAKLSHFLTGNSQR